MSRYILFPQNEPSIFAFIPADGFCNQIKTIRLPDGIAYVNIFSKVHNRNQLRKLLYKILKTDIQRTKDGLVADKYSTINTEYDEALVKSCNGIFLNNYEKFYCLLRRNGVTF